MLRVLIQATRADTEVSAADANLRAGDSINQVDGLKIGSVRDLEEAIGKLPSARVLRLLIPHRGTLMYTMATVQ